MPVGLFLFAIDAGAVPIVAPYTGLSAFCADFAGIVTMTEELGNPGVVPFGGTGPFPADEAIASEITLVPPPGCTSDPAQGAAPDYIVHIKNLTTSHWKDLFFVADAGNSFNHYDGMILGGFAMRIDQLGVNIPLLSESMTLDGIFEPGEDWFFAVRDWVGPAAPSFFDSIGIGAGFPPSTASIVANPVPVPAAIWLLGSALGVLGWMRRRVAD